MWNGQSLRSQCSCKYCNIDVAFQRVSKIAWAMQATSCSPEQIFTREVQNCVGFEAQSNNFTSLIIFNMFSSILVCKLSLGHFIISSSHIMSEIISAEFQVFHVICKNRRVDLSWQRCGASTPSGTSGASITDACGRLTFETSYW